jgi:hypothetical protein
MKSLPEIPGRFQNDFVAQRALAEAQYANRAVNSSFDASLHRLNLIQKVHRAYFKCALDACRAGLLTPTEVSQSTDASWPIICDFYFAREHWKRWERDQSKFRARVWPAINLDPQYRQYQLELAALAERVSATATPPSSAEPIDDAIEM